MLIDRWKATKDEEGQAQWKPEGTTIAETEFSQVAKVGRLTANGKKTKLPKQSSGIKEEWVCATVLDGHGNLCQPGDIAIRHQRAFLPTSL